MTHFSKKRKVKLSCEWHGTDYEFIRNTVDQYGEPNGTQPVQTIRGIHHANSRSLIALLTTEGSAVKNKVTEGIFFDSDVTVRIKQGDQVRVGEKMFIVTTVEPLTFEDVVVAYDASIEEVVEGANDEV